jgi:hypothetical protein
MRPYEALQSLIRFFNAKRLIRPIVDYKAYRLSKDLSGYRFLKSL